MPIEEDLTTFVALWGAILATILAIYQYHNSFPRLKVEHGTPVIMSDITIPPRVVFLMQATNWGKRSVLVLSYGLYIPKKKKKYVFPFNVEPDNLPKMLKDGEMVNLWIPPRAVAQALQEEGFKDSEEVSMRAYFTTSTGKRTYYSKKEKVTISHMLDLDEMK